MLEHLFGSKTRLKLIRLFFRRPGTPFFVRELTRLTGVQINAIRRELELLLKAGLVKEIDNVDVSSAEYGSGLRKYYTLNLESIFHGEIKALILKDQMAGEQEFIKQIQEKGGLIKLFIITGQFTGDQHAPSDILLVGNVKERSVARLVAEHEQEFGFEIRYTLMPEKEFMDRRHVMDKFLYAMFEAKHEKIVNEYNV